MKLFEKFYDKKYSKICIYTIKTLILTFVLGMITYYLSKTVGPTFSFIGSILTPLILGIVLAYLFTPLVEFFERKVFSKINEAKRRPLAVALTFVLLILVILLILFLLMLMVLVIMLMLLRVRLNCTWMT